MLSLLLLFFARPTHIPSIATIFGVRVGFNGRGSLEKEFGVGKYSVGGHPNGTETWRLRSPRSTVETEGFSYVRDGELIESLDWVSGGNGIGKARISRSRGWLGCILLGDSKQSVFDKTSLKLPKPVDSTEGALTWRSSGYLVARSNPNTLTEWSARLCFDKNDRLICIELLSHN